MVRVSGQSIDVCSDEDGCVHVLVGQGLDLGRVRLGVVRDLEERHVVGLGAAVQVADDGPPRLLDQAPQLLQVQVCRSVIESGGRKDQHIETR